MRVALLTVARLLVVAAGVAAHHPAGWRGANMPQHLASKDAMSSINDQDYDPMSKQAPRASDWSVSGGKAKQYTVEVKDMDLEGSEQAWYLACKNIIVNDQSRPNAVGHQYLRKHSTAQTTDGLIPFMTTAGCWSEFYHDGKKDIRDLGKETAKALDFFVAQTIINHPRPKKCTSDTHSIPAAFGKSSGESRNLSLGKPAPLESSEASARFSAAGAGLDQNGGGAEMPTTLNNQYAGQAKNFGNSNAAPGSQIDLNAVNEDKTPISSGQSYANAGDGGRGDSESADGKQKSCCDCNSSAGQGGDASGNGCSLGSPSGNFNNRFAQNGDSASGTNNGDVIADANQQNVGSVDQGGSRLGPNRGNMDRNDGGMPMNDNPQQQQQNTLPQSHRMTFKRALRADVARR